MINRIKCFLFGHVINLKYEDYLANDWEVVE